MNKTTFRKKCMFNLRCRIEMQNEGINKARTKMKKVQLQKRRRDTSNESRKVSQERFEYTTTKRMTKPKEM